MLQFTVPQFIDVEDKIIGTITVRQFVILLAAVILMALGFKFLTFAAFFASAILIIVIAIVLAFVKINGAPFHYFVLNLIQTFKKPRLRVWRKDDTLLGVIEFDTQKKDPVVSTHPVYSASRLSELSLIVDTQGSYQGEGSDNTVITRGRSTSNLS